jgi:hypothetical protein
MRILVLTKTKRVSDPTTGNIFFKPIRTEVEWIFNSIQSAENHSIWIYDISKQVLFPFNEKKYIIVSRISWMPKLFRNILSNFSLFAKFKGKFDLSHIFYLRMEYQILSPWLFKFSKKTFISIYGTDYYGHRLPLLFNYCLKKCTKFSTTYEGLNNRILRKYGANLAKKNSIIPFPIMFFEAIQHYSPDKITARKKLGIMDSKILVVCGTRAGFEEQYEKVLAELKKMRLNNVQYLFTITYGDSKQKIDALEKEIREALGDKAIIFKSFMPIEKMIDIRLACDIFINLRSHDQFAGSMIESFYAKSHIITGSWLKYHGLKEEGFFYNTIDKISELPECLMRITSILDINEEIKNKLQQNRVLIVNKYQNEDTRLKWISFYKN